MIFVFCVCVCLCFFLVANHVCDLCVLCFCLFLAGSQVCDICFVCVLCLFVLCLCLYLFLAASQICDLCVEDDAVLYTSRITGSEVRVGNNVTILSFSLRVTCTRSSFWGANDVMINIIITIVTAKINKKT